MKLRDDSGGQAWYAAMLRSTVFILKGKKETSKNGKL